MTHDGAHFPVHISIQQIRRNESASKEACNFLRDVFLISTAFRMSHPGVEVIIASVWITSKCR